MTDSRLFLSLDFEGIAALIRQATQSVCYAAPGIHTPAALAMAEAAKRIGSKSVIACLDIDDQVFRMGFGTMQALDLLRDAGSIIQNVPGLRAGLIIVDQEGFMFAPTALLLESGNRSSEAPNAMRLSWEQTMQALARISPVTKAIAAAQLSDDEARNELLGGQVEVHTTDLSDLDFERVEQRLLEAPPAQFDLARQVRVYNARLQYVEIRLTGASIQRHRLPIPKVLQDLGGNKELEGRLRTTFDLIGKDDELSSRALEQDLKHVRDVLTRVIGGERVMVKAHQNLFEQRIEALRSKLQAHQEKVETQLHNQIESSLAAIVDYYLPIVEKDPPDALVGQLLSLDRADIKSWLENELRKCFPSADKLVRHMKLEVRYKDLTYQSLNADGFLEELQGAYPMINWDKAYSEFLASGERRSAQK